jgi:ribosome maturation protein Sdo1
MPTKANVASILKKHFGKEVADAMTAKIDKMIAEKKSAAVIEKAIRADLATQIEKQVVSAVIAKIGPITPLKVKPIQAAVKVPIRRLMEPTTLGVHSLARGKK